MMDALKKNLLTGLIILLPIAITLALVGFLINLFTDPFVDMISSILIKLQISPRDTLFISSNTVIRYVSKLLVLACLISFTTLLGVFARLFFVKSFLSYTDHVLQKIPVISAIYQASKEIVKSVFKSGPSSFSQVVLVPFPHPGIYALGLVSRPAPSSFFKTEGEALSVLILTTPNPTSGFLLMYKQTDLVYLDMKPEAAIKYIVSGGVLTPDMEPKK